MVRALAWSGGVVGRGCLLFALLGGWLLAALAMAAGYGPQPLQLDEETADLAANASALVLRDPGLQMQLPQVLQAMQAQQFEPVDPRQAENFGDSGAAVWLWFRIRNTSSSPLDARLLLNHTVVEQLQLWVLDAQAHVLSSARHGDFPSDDPTVQSSIPYRQVLLPLPLPAAQPVDVLLRVRMDGTQAFSTRLWSARALGEVTNTQYLIQGGYFGLLLVLAVYNLALYVALRERAYLAYVGYALALALFMGNWTGLARQYLWPQAYEWQSYAGTVLGMLASSGLLMFAQELLQVREMAPRLLPWVRLAMLLPLLNAAAMLLLGKQPWFFLAQFSALASLGMALSLGIYSMAARDPKGRPWMRSTALLFLTSTGLVLAGAGLVIGRNLGLVPHNGLTVFGIQIGSGIEMVMLSLGLALRVSRMREDARDKALDMERLRLRGQAAEEGLRAKSELLAAASHDLRQPLHALSLYFHQLAREPLGPAAQRSVQGMRRAVQSLLQLFNALLDLSKLEAGAVSVRPRPHPVHQLWDALDSEFRPLFQRKGLGLSFRPCPLWLQADPVLLQNIMRNYLSNALRYTQQGRVLVTARPRGNQHLLLQVWDTGVGLDEADQQRVFDAYVQLPNAQALGRSGLGLGLSIVRRSAELMGLPILLRSRKGRGSMFGIQVPCAPAQTSAHVATVAERQVDEPVAAESLVGLRVLVIDDDPQILEVLQDLLSQAGAQVGLATSIGQALQVCQSLGCPDILISDLRLGQDETGLDAVERIGDEFNTSIAALIVSGESSPQSQALVFQRGLPLLHKPLEFDTLRRAIIERLAAKSA